MKYNQYAFFLQKTPMKYIKELNEIIKFVIIIIIKFECNKI